jgi:hypothetical protein
MPFPLFRDIPGFKFWLIFLKISWRKQGNVILWKESIWMKNWNNQLGDQREDTLLTSNF